MDTSKGADMDMPGRRAWEKPAWYRGECEATLECRWTYPMVRTKAGQEVHQCGQVRLAP